MTFVAEALIQKYRPTDKNLNSNACRWILEHPDPTSAVPEIRMQWDRLLEPDLVERTHQTILWIKSATSRLMEQFPRGGSWNRERRQTIYTVSRQIEIARTRSSRAQQAVIEQRQREAAEKRREERQRRHEEHQAGIFTRKDDPPDKLREPARPIVVVEDEGVVATLRTWSKNYGRLRNLVEEHKKAVLEAGEPGEFDLALWSASEELNDEIAARGQSLKKQLRAQRESESSQAQV